MFKTVGLAVLGVVLTAAGAMAHESRFDRRQDRQLERIERGRETGSITWTEGLKLRREQRRISALKRHFESDGYISRRERRILRERQDEASGHISKEKHDGWRRAWWAPRVGR